jgi:hypothetical protein
MSFSICDGSTPSILSTMLPSAVLGTGKTGPLTTGLRWFDSFDCTQDRFAHHRLTIWDGSTPLTTGLRFTILDLQLNEIASPPAFLRKQEGGSQ